MKSYKEWIKRAKSSYHYSIATVDDYVGYEDLCYQAQQAAEKAIKALMIYHGIEPEHTHNIRKLLDELEKHVEVDERVKDAVDLTKFAVVTRYPGDYDEVTENMYLKAIKTAKTCLDWVESKIIEKE